MACFNEIFMFIKTRFTINWQWPVTDTSFGKEFHEKPVFLMNNDSSAFFTKDVVIPGKERLKGLNGLQSAQAVKNFQGHPFKMTWVRKVGS